VAHRSTSALAALLATLAAPAFAELIGEPSGSGPFPATAERREELPGHTVYRPVEWKQIPPPTGPSGDA